MHYYEVAPTKIVRANAHTFTYSSNDVLALGSFVRIPIGKQVQLGMVIEEVAKPSYETREIAELLDIPSLPHALVATSLWMSEYYHTHLAQVLQTVLPRGLTKHRRATRSTPSFIERDRTHFLLNKDQSEALDILQKTTPGTVLLHGVTGSGKTTVYIEYTRQILATNKSVIVLVPEIALTSQLVAEFQQHFPHIILTHSRQTEAERHLCWLEVARAEGPVVVIGPRSALFLPVQSIGAIIIDEAHEPSYKQEQSPRYSALRAAGILAKQYHCLVIQGTATPLITEYYLAQQRKRPIISLPTRARQDAIDPSILTIDMTKRGNFIKHRFFSDALLSAIATSLENHHQVLIFHNRRGSASMTLCENCGWSATCPHCFIPLTLHADIHTLRCHTCGFTDKVPTSCPVCGSTDIIHKGIGTKLIESELKKLFPQAAIMRFDGDSQNTETVESRYQALYRGEIQIIIGTQVIAKGLDLPHLRTVGVVQADAGLSLPDYSSSERAFQLIAQVVGRVGRTAHQTSVIIQSYQPNNFVVQCGIKQDYQEFYKNALATRQRGGFPPYTYLLKLTCSYKTEAAAIRNSKQLADTIKRQFSSIAILGPTPAFYERQRDSYRWQIVVKSPKRDVLTSIIDTIPNNHWQYDLDPTSLI